MDNVTNIEPADNEERLLRGILEGDTETNIEPAGNKERLLKAILENGGGGSGGATSVTLAASGDNLSGDISLADLKTALSNGVVLLSFPTDGNADERVVAEYTDDSTNGLRIGVFSEDEYIVYSVVDDGSDGITLTVVSEEGLGEQTWLIDGMDALWIMQQLQSFATDAAPTPGVWIRRLYNSSRFSNLVQEVIGSKTPVKNLQIGEYNVSITGIDTTEGVEGISAHLTIGMQGIQLAVDMIIAVSDILICGAVLTVV